MASDETEFPLWPDMKSAADFEAMIAWLPEMLEELVNSEVYGDAHRPPSGLVGLYLFSEEGRDLYVGRTGVTARSREGRTKQRTGFRERYRNHTVPSSPPSSAPFANRLLGELLAERGLLLPPKWWPGRQGEHRVIGDAFEEAKARVRQMEFRIVEFDDDSSGVRSTVAETYVHACLKTPYNNFLTS